MVGREIGVPGREELERRELGVPGREDWLATTCCAPVERWKGPEIVDFTAVSLGLVGNRWNLRELLLVLGATDVEGDGLRAGMTASPTDIPMPLSESFWDDESCLERAGGSISAKSMLSISTTISDTWLRSSNSLSQKRVLG